MGPESGDDIPVGLTNTFADTTSKPPPPGQFLGSSPSCLPLSFALTGEWYPRDDQCGMSCASLRCAACPPEAHSEASPHPLCDQTPSGSGREVGGPSSRQARPLLLPSQSRNPDPQVSSSSEGREHPRPLPSVGRGDGSVPRRPLRRPPWLLGQTGSSPLLLSAAKAPWASRTTARIPGGWGEEGSKCLRFGFQSRLLDWNFREASISSQLALPLGSIVS
jgi:hypothetical protein